MQFFDCTLTGFSVNFVFLSFPHISPLIFLLGFLEFSPVIECPFVLSHVFTSQIILSVTFFIKLKSFFLRIWLNPLIFPFMVFSFKRFLTYQSQVYRIFLPYFLLLASWFYLSHLPFKPNWSYFRRWYKRRTQRLKNRHVMSPFPHHYLPKNSYFLCGGGAPSNTH